MHHANHTKFSIGLQWLFGLECLCWIIFSIYAFYDKDLMFHQPLIILSLFYHLLLYISIKWFFSITTTFKIIIIGVLWVLPVISWWASSAFWYKMNALIHALL